MMKILVGAPVSQYHDYCTKEYLEGIRRLTYKNKDVVVVDNTADLSWGKKLQKDENEIEVVQAHNKTERIMDKIVSSRNVLRERAIKGEYDYFLSLEQDVVPPPDVIERLLAHNKEIVSAIYFGKIRTRESGAMYIPHIYRWPTEEEKKVAKEQFESIKRGLKKETIEYLEKKGKDISDMEIPCAEEEVREKKLMQIKMCGLGCVLIQREVLKKIIFRYNPEREGSDDYYFCFDARKEGFKLYADTSIWCKHLIKSRPWQWEDLLKKK